MYNGIPQIYVKPYVPFITQKPSKEVLNDPENPSGSKQPDNNSKDNNNASTGQEHKSAINYNTNRISINQILVDFKGTINAINPSEDIKQETSQYLNLAELQSQKEKPSPAIINSNLTNAAKILDRYIAETLKKPSEEKSSGVVLNWVNAVLLQKIDYKSSVKVSDKTETQNLDINPFAKPIPATDEPVKENIEESKEQTKISEKTANSDIIKLNNLYKNAAKATDSNDYDKALSGYQKALKIAKKVGDKDVQTKIYMDVAYIHDVNNNLPKALENYNNAVLSANKTGNKETQASAHYNMATIYDDVGKIDAALDHSIMQLLLLWKYR